MNSGISLEHYRKDFPSLDRRRNEKPAVYLDNACTALVPTPVIESIGEYYAGYPSCGSRRSRHWFAEEVGVLIEGDSRSGVKGSRRILAEFVNAAFEEEIIFALNTTHAINMVALGFKFQPKDIVLLSDKEHNSNLLPWLRLQKTGLIAVDYVPSTDHDEFDIDAFEHKMKNGRVRLVSMTYTSNATGYTLPVAEIIRIAHTHGALVLLDGALAVPRKDIDVQSLDVDFLAFSLHKMCGPRGVGVLYGKKELFEQNGVVDPVTLGGGTVADASYDNYTLLAPPQNFEAGIQNYPAQIASGVAGQYLQRIGIDRISAHETELNRFLTEGLMSRYGDAGWFRIMGPQDAEQRGGIDLRSQTPECGEDR
jgi:cysteine desulfurase / selenocysteine lyase